MADEPVSAAAPAAAAPAPAPAPAAAAPAPAPAAAPAPDAAPAPAPAAAPAPDAGGAPPVEGEKPADAVADALKPHAASDEPTLLETIGKKDEKTPDSAANPPDPGATPPEAPKKFDFKPFEAPEGVKFDDARVSVLNDVIGEGLGPQETRDKLLGMHIDEMKSYDSQLRQQQQDAFRDTRKDWLGKIKADPELGGSGFETTKTHVAEMRDLFASRHKPQTEGYIQDMAEFNHMLRYTGVGDHPSFWRFLNNVARKFKEPATPLTDIKPPPDLGRSPKGGKRGSMYDHPTSHNNRR